MASTDTRRIDPTQTLQEAEYAFPYHYVAQWKPRFTQCLNDNWGIHYISTIEFLLNKLGDHSFKSVVDIGCGDGRMSRELALRYPNRRVLGVDYSVRATGLAKAMNFDLPELRFEQLDITAPHTLPSSDAAILMEVFEHIPPADADEFLRGVHRLLAPGGTMLLTVPHVNHALEPKHFRHFSGTSIREALKENFDVLEIIPFEREGPVRKLLNLLLSNEIFILNQPSLRDWLYCYYKRRLFHVDDEAACRRLFVQARAK